MSDYWDSDTCSRETDSLPSLDSYSRDSDSLPSLDEFEDDEISVYSFSSVEYLSTICEEEEDFWSDDDSISSQQGLQQQQQLSQNLGRALSRRSLSYEQSLDSLRSNLELTKQISQRDLNWYGGLERRESFTRSKQIIEEASLGMTIRRNKLGSNPDLLEHLGGLRRRESFEDSKLKMQKTAINKVPSRALSQMMNEKFVIDSTVKQPKFDIEQLSITLARKRARKELASKKLRQAVVSIQKRQAMDTHQLQLHSKLFSITSDGKDTDDNDENYFDQHQRHQLDLPQQCSMIKEEEEEKQDNPQSGSSSFARLAAQNQKITTPSKAFFMKSPKLVQKRSRVRKALQNAERIKMSIQMTTL